VKLDVGKARPAQNQLSAFARQATVIVDHSLNPAGFVNPCMLVALDVVGAVLALLGSSVYSFRDQGAQRRIKSSHPDQIH
jgi:drug/metabolite transporter superfamily protein YnfA